MIFSKVAPIRDNWETVPDLLEILSPGNQDMWSPISLELFQLRHQIHQRRWTQCNKCIRGLYSNIHVMAPLSPGGYIWGHQINLVTVTPTSDICRNQTLLGLTQSPLTACSMWIIWLCFSKGGTKTVKKIFLETHYHLPSHINSLEENENRTFCPVFL